MDIKNLHCKNIKICNYCNYIKEIKHFDFNKKTNKYCLNCKDCNKDISKKMRYKIIKYKCKVCDRILTSPERLLKRCIKQHEECQIHVKNVRQNSALG